MEEEDDDEDTMEDVEEEEDDDDDDDEEEDDEEEMELEVGARGKYQQMHTIGRADKGSKSNRKILPGATLREWDA